MGDRQLQFDFMSDVEAKGSGDSAEGPDEPTKETEMLDVKSAKTARTESVATAISLVYWALTEVDDASRNSSEWAGILFGSDSQAIRDAGAKQLGHTLIDLLGIYGEVTGETVGFSDPLPSPRWLSQLEEKA